jgi:hypothetical protein
MVPFPRPLRNRHHPGLGEYVSLLVLGLVSVCVGLADCGIADVVVFVRGGNFVVLGLLLSKLL